MNQPGRRYVSEVRDEQARRTRRTIVTAARELFLTQGYAATTIDAIAEAAHVSRKTVFNAVGGKAVLLKLALDWALVGDDEPVPMAERPDVIEEQGMSDPRLLIRSWAKRMTTIESRAARLAMVIAAAA